MDYNVAGGTEIQAQDTGPDVKTMIPPQIVNHPPAFHLDLNTN